MEPSLLCYCAGRWFW